MDAKGSLYNLLKGAGSPAKPATGSDFLDMTTLDYIGAIYAANQRALLGIFHDCYFIEMPGSVMGTYYILRSRRDSENHRPGPWRLLKRNGYKKLSLSL